MFRKFIPASLIAALMAGTASADTLRDALVSAYQTNPTLTAQRETLKATDANVAIARAAGPSAGQRHRRTQPRPHAAAASRHRRQGPDPLGRSGRSATLCSTAARVKNSVRAAKTRVEAGRATLRAVEGDVFTQAVSAYMDVIRDRSIVELNQNNVRVLETNLEATRDRFQIGDLTRTDVAQSEARLQLGRSQLAAAQGRLTASEATYRQIIGHAPGAARAAAAAAAAPDHRRRGGADRARQQSRPGRDQPLRRSPPAMTSTSRGPAACRRCRRRRQRHLCRIISGGSIGPTRSQHAATARRSDRPERAMPIFQGGLPAARIRQAQALQGQVLEQVVGTERAVVQATRAAFATYDAAQKAIQSQTVAVQANELALEGARAEQSVGTRTILDVLNAEQELLNSQVALVTAKRDAYVAGFQLLNAMGQAEAQDLGLDGGPLYDPLGNYRRVAEQLERLGERPAPSDGRDPHGQPAGDAGHADRHAADRPAQIDPSPARARRTSPPPMTTPGVTQPQQ